FYSIHNPKSQPFNERYFFRKEGPGFPEPSRVTQCAAGLQLMAKQYRWPAPPVRMRPSFVQSALICTEFHDTLPPPVRSAWPSIALLAVLSEVQLLQVVSTPAGNAR